MRPNVIVLTKGLSGSSVLAGLLARAGYWTGDETIRKPDYDTFENQDLVALDRRLFAEVGYSGNYEMVFDPRDLELFESAAGLVDDRPYREFLRRCDAHQPWLWKDPRLWLTIRFWKHLLDLDRVRFLTLEREPLQTWISTTLRRQIQTPRYCRAYSDGVMGAIRGFLEEIGQVAHDVIFEDLLIRPEREIARLNAFLGTRLSVEDLRAVNSKPMYRRSRGVADLGRAAMIYAKNYRHRYR